MWRDEAYLFDILIAAKQAKKFSEELAWENFKTSSLHQHAIMRVLRLLVRLREKSLARREQPIPKFRGTIGSGCVTN